MFFGSILISLIALLLILLAAEIKCQQQLWIKVTSIADEESNPCQGKPNGSFQQHPLGCKYFILCSQGNVNTGVCPNGLAFNPAKPPCDLAAAVGCFDEVTTVPPAITQPTTTTTTPTTTIPPPTTRTSSTSSTSTTTTSRPLTTTTPRTTRASTTTTPAPTTSTSTSTRSTTSRTTSTPRPTSSSTTRSPTTTTTTTTTTTVSPQTTTTAQILTTNTPAPTINTTTIRPFIESPLNDTTQNPLIEPHITCPDLEDPEKIIFRSSTKDCSRYYICYHNSPMPMSCAAGLHWSIKSNRCDTPENAECLISTVPSFFPICPREMVGFYPHPLNCELFLYCYHGHMTVQQCPFYYHWDVETESCELKNVAKCVINQKNMNKYLTISQINDDNKIYSD